MGSVGAPGGTQGTRTLRTPYAAQPLLDEATFLALGPTPASGWRLTFRQRKKNPGGLADQGFLLPGRPVRVAFQVHCGRSTHCRLTVVDGLASKSAKPNRTERQRLAAAFAAARQAFDQRGVRSCQGHRVFPRNAIFKSVGAAFYGCLAACQTLFAPGSVSTAGAGGRQAPLPRLPPVLVVKADDVILA